MLNIQRTPTFFLREVIHADLGDEGLDDDSITLQDCALVVQSLRDCPRSIMLHFAMMADVCHGLLSECAAR